MQSFDSLTGVAAFDPAAHVFSKTRPEEALLDFDNGALIVLYLLSM